MKNFSKTIAALGLSLLTVGAMAQVPFKGTPETNRSPIFHKGPALYIPQANQAKHVSANVQSFQMDYIVNDATASAAYSVTSQGWFADQLNYAFTKNDTNAAASRENFNLIQQAIVAFDTIFDQNGVPYSAQAGSMHLDTLWAGPCWYKNTSGLNDTLVFTVDSVNSKGYPSLKAFATFTVALFKGVTFTVATPGGPSTITFSGTSLDTGFSMLCTPNFTVPNNHVKFAVSVSFKGSKADTLNIGFGFPYSVCGASCGFANSPYANPFTVIGNTFTSKAPRTINANSFAYGWSYEYGSNGPVILPQPDGTIFDNSNQPYNYEWNICGAGCTTDTMYFYEQDYGIYASVTFNDATGISNINPSGLSVSQNYPNPFNKETTITYSVLKSSTVNFAIYDITGRIVTSNNYGSVAPGQYEINLSANTFSPGIYFYTFNVNGSTVTKKMVITE